jgi:acyl carrier protein
MDVRGRLRRFIEDTFFVEGFRDDESFLASGIVDSLGVMQLVSFLQAEFSIAVADADLVPDNFDSVAKVAAFVERRLGDRGARPGRSASDEDAAALPSS